MHRLHDVNDLLVEGGSATATAFLAEDLVDRILIYRAPIIVGEGKSSFGYVGLDGIASAQVAVVATFDETAKRIVAYTLVLWATSLVFWPAGAMGWIYLGAALVLGGLFTWKAVALARSHKPDQAMKLFKYSITYITLLFGAMAADQLLLH